MSIKLTQSQSNNPVNPLEPKTKGITLTSSISSSGKKAPTIEQVKQFAAKRQQKVNPLTPKRNILQKGAGLFLDPIAKLATETGRLAGTGIVKGVEMFQSPEQKAETEKKLQGALSEKSVVPGLGTEVKPQKDITAEDVGGQVLSVAGLATGNPLLAGAAMGAGGAMEEGQGIGGVTLNALGGALTGKVLEVGFKAVAPQIEKAIQKYGMPMFEKLQAHIPEAVKDTYKSLASKVKIPSLPEIKTPTLDKAQGFFSRIEKKATEPVISGIKTGVQKGYKSLEPIVVGKEAMYKAGKISAPETQAYLPKEQGGQGKTFGEVVDKTEKAINAFKQKSMTALSDVKSKITGNHFKVDDVKGEVRNALDEVLGNRAKSRGLVGENMSKAQVQDLKDYGLINPNEEEKIKGMIKTIANNPDNTDRGILNLKEDIYKNYYKAGNQDYQTSNKIVKSIYDRLNNLVGSANPKLKPALDIASKNIADSESMLKQLLGTGAEREAKLKTLATNLKNGAINADDLALLKQLEETTGIQITPDLEGYANYAELLSEKAKTGQFPTAIGVKLKAGASRIGIAGGIGAGAAEVKNLLGI